ncbi:MAG: YHS domain-containing (seleno)protein [Litorimonas sp.]
MRALLAVLLLALASCTAPVAEASKPEIYTSWRNDIAVDGYDVVSFHAGRPVRGRTEFSARYRGVTWRFDTQANLDLFETNPAAFAPQFGGYCAWAVAMGKLAPGNAEHWHVEDGKLYLNYSVRVKKRWDALRDEFIDAAEENWPALLSE